MLSWNQMNGFSLPYHQMAPYQMSMPTIPGPKVIYDNNFIPQSISVPISAPFQLTAVADQIKVDDLKDRIKVKLVEEDLWKRFEKVQNEMIITKAGRNPLPKLYFTVEGLEPENCYLFSMAFRRVGNEKYISDGPADEEFEQKEYPHIENVRFPKGSEWMKSELSFAKLKLTTNQENKNAVVLRPMHKYCPVLIIYRFNPETSNFERFMEKEIHLGTFIAVTAYQNPNVTNLKFGNNPYAKGFRDGESFANGNAKGVFNRLKDNILEMVSQEPTPDLMPETLVALSAIMLAQAQEFVYLKTSKSNMSADALVKIANQGEQFYTGALSMMSRDNVKGVFDKDWINTVSGKAKGLEAAANFHFLKMCESEPQICKQICRLMEAVHLADQMKPHVSEDNSPTLCVAATALQAAQKNNDFIYHERGHDPKSLPQLDKAAVDKPTPIEGHLLPRFNLFESLVPVSIQNAIAVFEGRKAGVVFAETGRLRKYTQLLNDQLDSLNLPAASEDVLHHEKCPESFLQKSSKVKQCGGVQSIFNKIAELPSLYLQNVKLLNESQRLIQEEKQSDDYLRQQFKEKWTPLASERLTGPLSEEIEKYRSILENALKSDNLILTKYEQQKWGIELLSKPENELKEAISGLGNLGDSQNSSAVNELRELVNKTTKIKAEREKLEQSFKDVSSHMSAEFLQSLSGSDSVNEENISKTKIHQLLGPLKEQVNKSIAEQEAIMEKVQTINKKFTADRDNILKTLASAYDTYFELEGNLKEAKNFYNDLTPMLLQLQQKVTDFCFARKTEKDDLMKKLQQNIVSGETGKNLSAKAPLPRYPPPISGTLGYGHFPPPYTYMQPKQNNQLPAAYPVYYPPQMQQWYPSQQQPYPQYLPPQHQEQPIRNPPYPLGYPFHLPPGNPNNTNPFK